MVRTSAIWLFTVGVFLVAHPFAASASDWREKVDNVSLLKKSTSGKWSSNLTFTIDAKGCTPNYSGKSIELKQINSYGSSVAIANLNWPSADIWTYGGNSKLSTLNPISSLIGNEIRGSEGRSKMVNVKAEVDEEIEEVIEEFGIKKTVKRTVKKIIDKDVETNIMYEYAGVVSPDGNTITGEVKCQSENSEIDKRLNSSWKTDTGIIPFVLTRVGSNSSNESTNKIKTVKVWIKAFIPGKIDGYTLTVPKGPYAGQTVIPGLPPKVPPHPFITTGFRTDQRGFDNSFSASARMTSSIEINTQTMQAIPSDEGYHRIGETVEVDMQTGLMTCSDKASSEDMRFDTIAVNSNSRTFITNITGAAKNPCVWPSPDIDYVGKITIEINSNVSGDTATVSFKGYIDEFPAFEMYASVNGKPGQAIFQSNPAPGWKKVWGLVGPANRSVIRTIQLQS
jgi:hypothetical protein